MLQFMRTCGKRKLLPHLQPVHQMYGLFGVHLSSILIENLELHQCCGVLGAIDKHLLMCGNLLNLTYKYNQPFKYYNVAFPFFED